jgi:glycoprotein endo-alpha-1,2-mannosidase
MRLLSGIDDTRMGDAFTKSLTAGSIAVVLCVLGRCQAQEELAPSGTSPAHAPAESDGSPLVGAYYYPWYGGKGRDTASDWRNVFRQRLRPSQAPAAGLYNSDDPAVVKEHIAQSRRAGLDFWAVSWWGPDSLTDRVFREVILTHPDATQLRFAVLYESTGRFGPLDRPKYDKWLTDLAYLEEHYFNHPQYLKIDGRPALFIYLSRVYFRDRGAEPLAAAREQFKDVYIIGDDVFGSKYLPEWARQFDAVTAYDVYGQSTGIQGSTTKAVSTLAKNYALARDVANSVGTAFIPAVAPGYNDTVIRTGHPGAARRLADQPTSHEGDLFRQMIREAALANLDSKCGRILMVTSFNEWYEDTQIEATTGAKRSTTEDDSESGRNFTAGDQYVDYGHHYIDIVRELTKPASDARR